MSVNVGDKIRIIHMEGESRYTGKIGIVTHIDDAHQIHGTWGGCALCAVYGDKWEVIERK